MTDNPYILAGYTICSRSGTFDFGNEVPPSDIYPAALVNDILNTMDDASKPLDHDAVEKAIFRDESGLISHIQCYLHLDFRTYLDSSKENAFNGYCLLKVLYSLQIKHVKGNDSIARYSKKLSLQFQKPRIEYIQPGQPLYVLIEILDYILQKDLYYHPKGTPPFNNSNGTFNDDPQKQAKVLYDSLIKQPLPKELLKMLAKDNDVLFPEDLIPYLKEEELFTLANKIITMLPQDCLNIFPPDLLPYLPKNKWAVLPKRTQQLLNGLIHTSSNFYEQHRINLPGYITLKTPFHNYLIETNQIKKYALDAFETFSTDALAYFPVDLVPFLPPTKQKLFPKIFLTWAKKYEYTSISVKKIYDFYNTHITELPPLDSFINDAVQKHQQSISPQEKAVLDDLTGQALNNMSKYLSSELPEYIAKMTSNEQLLYAAENTPELLPRLLINDFDEISSAFHASATLFDFFPADELSKLPSLELLEIIQQHQQAYHPLSCIHTLAPGLPYTLTYMVLQYIFAGDTHSLPSRLKVIEDRLSVIENMPSPNTYDTMYVPSPLDKDLFTLFCIAITGHSYKCTYNSTLQTYDNLSRILGKAFIKGYDKTSYNNLSSDISAQIPKKEVRQFLRHNDTAKEVICRNNDTSDGQRKVFNYTLKKIEDYYQNIEDTFLNHPHFVSPNFTERSVVALAKVLSYFHENNTSIRLNYPGSTKKVRSGTGILTGAKSSMDTDGILSIETLPEEIQREVELLLAGGPEVLRSQIRITKQITKIAIKLNTAHDLASFLSGWLQVLHTFDQIDPLDDEH